MSELDNIGRVSWFSLLTTLRHLSLVSCELVDQIINKSALAQEKQDQTFTWYTNFFNFLISKLYIWYQLVQQHDFSTETRGSLKKSLTPPIVMVRKDQQLLNIHADKNVPNLTFRVLCLILIWRIFIMFYFFWCLLLILIWIQVYSSPCSLLAHILFAVHLISEWNKK